MIQMQFPEFLLLIVPLTFLCWRWGTFAPDWKWLVPALAWGASHWWWMPPFWSHLWLIFPLAMFLKPWLAEAGMTGALRMAVALLLLFALTGPEWNLGGTGIDVVIVVDRSRSMPAEANLKELIANIGTNRKSGDRVSVVTFGTESRVEHELSDKVSLGEFGQVIAPDGSDLNDALLTALDRVDRNRPARILVLSDGESNGAPPTFAARRAREMGVPIDYRLFERPRVGDVAVRDLILPEEVEPREPLQLSVEVYSNKQTTGTLTLLRDGQQVASREVDLLPGTATFPFRDIIDRVGLAEYRAELTVEEDPLPENNSSAGVVRVSGESRLLVLNSDGQSGNLVRELLAAKLPVDVVRASEHPLTRESLDSYAAVIVENVPAQELGLTKMEVLAQFVEDMGGGFLLTGGKRSFGVGGYFRSPLDEVLPVSMEMREEHRKTNIAIAVALDRSGSMSMTVPGGMQKMDLANLGTAEVVKMLTPGDSIAVIAVDSDAHIIQPLTDVTNPEAIAKKIRGIRSEGGGIYVYNALVAAGTELAKAVQATKHIILFSDAQDSEEPGAYATLIAKYRKAGITVSVIGLGTLHDPDAKLLQDIAKLGDGNCMFTEDAKSLPKLFSADTMSVVRSNFVEKDEKTQPDGIGGAMLPNARLMGNLPELAVDGFPNVDGFNLSYLKPLATAAVKTTDEFDAPLSAFWYRGLGRVAALSVEVDGQFSGAFGRWDNYDDFLVTHARWLMGTQQAPKVFLDLQRVGKDALLTVELDPQRADRGFGLAPDVFVIPPGAGKGERFVPELTWTSPDTLEARFTLDQTGTYLTMLSGPEKSDDGRLLMTRGPAVTLPYSPEFAPREGQPLGGEVLMELAEMSGGVSRLDVVDILGDPPTSARTTSMLPWLCGAVIGILLLEIAGRRLSLWSQLADVTDTMIPQQVRPSHWAKRLSTRNSRKSQKQSSGKTPVGTTAPAAEPSTSNSPWIEIVDTPPKGSDSANQPPSPPIPPDAPAATDIFSAAKNRARRRMK